MTPDSPTFSSVAPAAPAPASSVAPLMGFAVLFRMALAEIDLVPLRAALIDRAARNPDDAHTLLDLSTVLQLTGNREIALQVQAQALRMQQLYRLSPHARPDQIRLLAIMGPGDLMANTPVECLTESTGIALDMLYLGPGLPFPSSVPDHDAAIVCVAESDENRPLLAQIGRYLQDWPRPVLNAPDRILWLSREGVCSRLASAPGVVMPPTVRIHRSTLERIGAGTRPLGTVLEDDAFPIVVRPAGSHAGHGLVRVDQPSDIAAYLQQQPELEFCVTRFIDYRQPDGLFRKYRIALIDGRPFICHLAISERWMIHYLNAGMADSAAKRAEEAEAMETFDHRFARRHDAAFRAIHERMGLDYLGIDCGETPDGRLLVFEVDNSMIVHAMDPVDLYPYKQPQMRKVFTAFREMPARRIAGREHAHADRVMAVRPLAAEGIGAEPAA